MGCGAKMKGEPRTLVVSCLWDKKILWISLYWCLSFEAFFESILPFFWGCLHRVGVTACWQPGSFVNQETRGFFPLRATEEELLALLRDYGKNCKIHRISFNEITSVIKSKKA